MRLLQKILLLTFFTFLNVSAQELPPIIKHSPISYGGGNQNWMIAQDQNQYLYFANNEGLLTFDGSKWDLYPSPNETIFRSVKVIGERIYTGCYMEFGYWIRHKNGRLLYTSLSKKVFSKIQSDEQFWNIHSYDHWVVFQSLNKIFIFDTKKNTFKIIHPKSGILKSFRTSSAICFQTNDNELYEIVSGKAIKISNDPILKRNKIINVFAIEKGLLIQTQDQGFYTLIEGTVSKFTTSIDAQLFSSKAYSSWRLSNGAIAIGTISNGVFIIDKNGALQHHINQSNGLSNNTVLSLFEDNDANLWLGLDNGINCINLNSPVKTFSDNSGVLGTIYVSKKIIDFLYVGTNQGLFFKKYNSNDSFRFVSGTKGQVWSLFAWNGELFCGHDSGTFVVKGAIAVPIYRGSGTWKFSTILNKKDVLLQGDYRGISVLQKINNQWVYKNKIEGFNYSAKNFEITPSLEVYVSHEYKGIFRLQLDRQLTKTKSFYTYSSPKKGKNASLIKYNGVIYYAYKEGIFKLNPKTKQFEKDAFLSAIFKKEEYTSGRMIVDDANRLWLFTKNYVHYLSLSKLDAQLKDNAFPMPLNITNSMVGYENCTQLSNSVYLFGTVDGYYTLNLDDLKLKKYKVAITNITVNRLNEEAEAFSTEAEGEYNHKLNNFLFNYTVPEYNKFMKAEYQYMLEGLDARWSSWSAKSSINFKNLPPGDYVFKVRAKFSDNRLGTTAQYKFSVLKPWYWTNLAVFIYFILALVMGYYIHAAYQKNYAKQEAKLIEENNFLLEIKELENEKELMRVRNEQLSQDVDSKSRELAVSTMSLNNKNELLEFIKEDLKKSASHSTSNIRTVISTINKNITKDDSWHVFKEAFDNVDKDFLKKVKVLHPTLTPNDLRLCAYLRVNLSSKEIAPLLNISVRSVEIKRYRLRKKMDLLHEQSLVDYILKV
ncbi:regulatory protein, luxR family [Flavobacterium succinicans]|uniref:Regulatory protein, luxR family n=1 Tax=Flavobacterium succinicans TaxID=29536 RepID=A0A1I4TTJ3_9FLAO|nr:triple tyrosine motif-containing protein [Flavobacterium succinicans]SFM80112.1 regulatory protein, luxR family [Flavobacterium succinicans]